MTRLVPPTIALDSIGRDIIYTNAFFREIYGFNRKTQNSDATSGRE